MSENEKQGSKTALGLVLGVAVGAAIGLVVFPDNIALGIPIGVAIGLAIGAGWDAQDKKKEDLKRVEEDPTRVDINKVE